MINTKHSGTTKTKKRISHATVHASTRKHKLEQMQYLHEVKLKDKHEKFTEQQAKIINL